MYLLTSYPLLAHYGTTISWLRDNIKWTTDQLPSSYLLRTSQITHGLYINCWVTAYQFLPSMYESYINYRRIIYKSLTNYVWNTIPLSEDKCPEDTWLRRSMFQKPKTNKNNTPTLNRISAISPRAENNGDNLNRKSYYRDFVLRVLLSSTLVRRRGTRLNHASNEWTTGTSILFAEINHP